MLHVFQEKRMRKRAKIKTDPKKESKEMKKEKVKVKPGAKTQEAECSGLE